MDAGMRRCFSTTNPKIPSSTAGEAEKRHSLNTWVAMATVTLGWGQGALLEELKKGEGNRGRHVEKIRRGED